MDAGDGEWIVAGCTDRTGFSTTCDAGDRRLAGRESGDGSDSHFCDHADTGESRRQLRLRRPTGWRVVCRGKRSARSSRVVAGAGCDHSERPGFHRALGRKRGPMRCVHRSDRGRIDGAVSNGEPGSDSPGAAGIHPHQGPDYAAVRTFWFSNVRVRKCSGAAVRRAGGRPGQRTGGGFARKYLPGTNRGCRLQRSSKLGAIHSRGARDE